MSWDRETGAGLRVLIVRVGAMGDVLHALPAVAALRRALPQAWIGWVIEPRWLPLLTSAPLQVVDAGVSGPRDVTRPLVDAIYLARTKDWKKRPLSAGTLREIGALRAQLRAGRFNLCVDLQGSIRSAVIGRMAGVTLAGLADPRERPAAWLYRRRVKTAADHVIEQGVEVLGGATGLTLRPAPVTLPVDTTVEAPIDARLAAMGVSRGGFALLAPGAGWGAKQWPAERYGQVAAALAARGVGVLISAYSEHDALAEAVVAASGGQARLFACDLAELIALTRRAALVIAGDTGPLHLAAALGVPVVALFGPTDPARNGPYGTPSRVLRRGEARRDHRRLSDPEAGLLAITVEDVAEAAFEMLERGTAATEDPSDR